MQTGIFTVAKTLGLLAVFCCGLTALRASVIVNFDPSTPSTGPFPTDYLTTPNTNQKTGLSVNLPMPNCGTEPSECGLVSTINLLDGFYLQPRVTVNFSGAINPNTLQAGIVFVWLYNVTNDEVGLGPDGKITSINQVVYDPTTNTAYAKPNDFFDQHRHYALVVTDAVRDTSGNPVQPDPRFTSCITSSSPTHYCGILQEVMGVLNPADLPGNVVAVSAFTTMSATAWMEAARDLLPQIPVGFKSAGASVPIAGITSLNLKVEVDDNPVSFQSVALPTPATTWAGINRIAFGTYQSPNFLNANQYIPFVPTGTALTLPPAHTISFHAYIPSSAMPSAGYPVIIYGHGFEDNSFTGTPTAVASNFAQAGFVTLAINAVGHGGGPQSVIELMKQSTVAAQFPSGGRGIDLNADGQIANAEGCFLTWPIPAGLADCIQQTAIDILQLANLVHSGTGIEPATGLKLDPTRIYYSGNSLGAIYGTLVTALDPNVPAAALDVGGGSPLDINRWSVAYNSYAQELVAGYTPSLLNAGSGYNENYVLRNQPPKVNTVTGAIAIQNLFEQLNWLQETGDPLSYAMHFNLTPLPNVPAKSALFTYDLGDQSVPNPMQSALIRDAGMFSSSTLLRTDLAGPMAAQMCCQLPVDNHGFLTNYTNSATYAIAQAAQQELAGYLASGGTSIPNANAALQKQVSFSINAAIFQTPGIDLETLNFGTTAPFSASFSLAVNPSPQTVLPGTITTFAATVSAIGGFNGSVSLTVSGLPSGATAAFSPASISGSGSSTLTISTSSSIRGGTYPLTITGTSGSMIQTATVTLTVQSVPVSEVQVSLSSFYNREGIVTDGTAFNTGLDTFGNAYSGTLLGTTQTYNNLTFTLGPPNAANVVAGGATIPLPAGSYSRLSFLGTAVNGPQVSQVFTVKYSDGTSTSFTQSLNNWSPGPNYAGETTVLSMSYRDMWNGTTTAGTFGLFGYSFTLNSAKTVASLTLPSNSNVVVVALSLLPVVTPVQVPLSSYYNLEAIVTDGTDFHGGADGFGNAYSSNVLGGSLTFNGSTFTLGPANALDVVSSTGQVVTLPAGEFTELNVLATGVNGLQTSQTFTVAYTDGSTSVFTQSLSNWTPTTNQGGETTVKTMAYRNVWNGAENATSVAVYGYSFTLNSSKLVSTITLPNDANVLVLGLSLVN